MDRPLRGSAALAAVALALGVGACADPSLDEGDAPLSVRRALFGPGCTTAFQDDFESGTLAAWDRVHGSKPTVTSVNPIAGTRSMSSVLGTVNIVGRSFPPRSRLRLRFTVDLQGMKTSGSYPRVVALQSTADGYTPLRIFLGKDAGKLGSPGVMINRSV